MRSRVTAAFVAVLTASVAAQRTSTPRTPWGDPDLQGTYTNTYENGTAFERPDQFAGRTLEDVKGEELKKMRLAIQERTIAAFLGPEHAPDNWWQPNLNLDKGSQAWFVIDPPDGKIPPMTPEAQKRIAARAAARQASGRGPADSYRNANPGKLKVTERFSRLSPQQLRWIVTIDDPTTWTKPWTFSMPLTVDDNPVPSYECHEGNYGLRNTLSAARAEERQRAR